MNSLYFNDQMSLILNSIDLDVEHNIKLVKRLIKKYRIPTVKTFQDFKYEIHLYKINEINFLRKMTDEAILKVIANNKSGYKFNFIKDVVYYVTKIYLTYNIFRFGSFTDESTFIKSSDILANNVKPLLESIDTELDIVAYDNLFHELIDNEIENMKLIFKDKGAANVIGAETLDNTKVFFRNQAYMYDILADNILSVLIVK